MRGRLTINAHSAKVAELGNREARRFAEKGLVKRTAWRKEVSTYSIGLSLSNLLYPDVFPRSVASSLDGLTTYSKRIDLDPVSLKGMRAYYNRKTWEWIRRSAGQQQTPQSIRQGKMLQKQLHAFYESLRPGDVEKLVARIRRESGIQVNTRRPNIAIDRNGQIVCFEPETIHLPTLLRRLERLPERTSEQRLRKKQAFSLYDSLKKLAKGKKTVRVHGVEEEYPLEHFFQIVGA